jgi:large subunit ribosomal protein L25
MAVQHVIEAKKRAITGKKVKRLRRDGLIPATVYGKGFTPVSIQVDDRAFNLTFRKAGRTSLIDLMIDGAQTSVFVQDVQRHPLSRGIIHIDFKVVDLKVAMQVEVPVVAVGESPLVARGDALLNHALNVVMVEALPADIPQHIEVDVSGLDDFDKSIHAGDIKAEGKYKILTAADTVVLSLTTTRGAAEEPADEATPAEPELIRKPRADDEE